MSPRLNDYLIANAIERLASKGKLVRLPEVQKGGMYLGTATSLLKPALTKSLITRTRSRPGSKRREPKTVSVWKRSPK